MPETESKTTKPRFQGTYVTRVPEGQGFPQIHIRRDSIENLMPFLRERKVIAKISDRIVGEPVVSGDFVVLNVPKGGATEPAMKRIASDLVGAMEDIRAQRDEKRKQRQRTNKAVEEGLATTGPNPRHRAPTIKRSRKKP